MTQVNRALLAGEVERPGVLPRLEALEREGPVFRVEFGLRELPEAAGAGVTPSSFLRGA